MIHIYIRKENGKYHGTASKYPEITFIGDTYEKCRDYMVSSIIQKQKAEPEPAKEKARKPKIGFAA